MKRLIAALLLFVTTVAHSEYEIVAYPELEDAKIHRIDVLHIFSQKMQYWRNGKRIKLVLLPWESRIHKEFATTVLRVRPERLRSAVEQRINSGYSLGYEQVSTLWEAIDYILLNEGAIGYTDKFMLFGSADGVKVIEIIG